MVTANALEVNLRKLTTIHARVAGRISARLHSSFCALLRTRLHLYFHARSIKQVVDSAALSISLLLVGVL